MFKFRQLMIEHADELADIIVREGGKTHGDALGEIARGRETVDFVCGINAALKGEFTDQASQWCRRTHYASAGRRRRWYLPLQLPGHGAAVDAPGSPGHR